MTTRRRLHLIGTVILVAGSLFLDGVHFGSWAVVLPLVVAVVAAATSVMFVILKVARTSEQASLAMSIIAISLGIGGGTFFRLPSEGWVADLLQVNPVASLVRRAVSSSSCTSASSSGAMFSCAA